MGFSFYFFFLDVFFLKSPKTQSAKRSKVVDILRKTMVGKNQVKLMVKEKVCTVLCLNY